MTPVSTRRRKGNRRAQPALRQAFTLVEILVAMAVLSLIVLVVVQIFNTSSTAISQNSKNMNALDAAESVLQQIGLDTSRMILRNDVDYSFEKIAAGASGNLPGNDVLSFYARTPGLSATGVPSNDTPRPLSVVKYQVVQNAVTNLLELDYGALQIDWDNAGSNPLVLTSATQLLTTPNTLPAVASLTTIAPEVIRMEISFVLATDPVPTDSPPRLLTPVPPVYVAYSSTQPQNPSALPFPIQNVAGIMVGLVVIDPKSRLLLPPGADVKVAQLFPDAVANEDLLALWTPKNIPSQLSAAGVPPPAMAGIRVYQKYFPLPW